MPVIDNTNGLAAQTGGGAGALMVGGGGTGVGQTTTVAAPAVPGAAAPSSSGVNVPNLMGYLNANQGNDAAMGQAVSGVVGKAGQESNQANTAYQANATSQIAAATPTVDPNVISTIDKATPTAATNITYQSAPTAVSYTGPTAENVAYTGPTSAATVGAPKSTTDATLPPAQPNLLQAASTQGDGSYGMASGANGTLESQITQSQNGMPGITSLLGNAYNNSSMGENNLNAALVNAGQGGQQQIQGINSQWGQQPAAFQKMVGGVNDQITAAKKTADATNATYAAKIKAAQDQGTAVNAQNTAAYNAAVKGHNDQVAAQQKADADAAAAKAKADADARAAAAAAAAKPAPAPAPAPTPPPVQVVPAGQLAINPTPQATPFTPAPSAVYGNKPSTAFVPGQLMIGMAHGGEVPYSGAMKNIPSLFNYIQGGSKKEKDKK